MSNQQYLDFLKVLENELLSFRWGCVYDLQNNLTVAEYGNVPSETSTSLPEQCHAAFQEAVLSQEKSNELMVQDDQWILLMRQFTKSPHICCILLRSGGITTGWARDTLKQKILESSFQ